VVDGLEGPTQFQVLDDGRVLIAQLNGDENGATGQVVVVTPSTGERRVLLGNLRKPTGVVLHQGAIWVMVERGLIRAAWDGVSAPKPPEVLLDNLPFNGRSSGTLTVLADDRVLYTTTGNLDAGQTTPGSGRLWAYDPATGESEEIAYGLKNAYAHVLLPDGSVAVVDMGDNITDPPVEEINVIDSTGSKPINLGWPNCPGDQECAGVEAPLATFPARYSPTGLSITPDGLSLVTVLHTQGTVMAVRLEDGVVTQLAEDLDLPHSVVVTPQGETLVSEHGAGRIVAVLTPQG
jgi:glucose/arabinose dehydrogenase